ncbi:MAG TPA: alpha/beta hydrolase [Kofleriaceae bacterium]|nr:alpha/beta hydrolase [Kofleriaceae bacterium]
MTVTIRANGLDFACLEEGSGPLVLLLHGFPDTAHTWDLTRPVLARAGFRAVSPFLRGYAPTAIPADGDYRIDTLAADVAGLIEALGEEQAIVVGHDWGASAAFGAAILFPERVRFLVTLAIPHPASVRPTPALLWKARHFFTLRTRGAAGRLRADDFAAVDRIIQRWSPAWQVPADESRAVKRAFAAPGCLEAAIGYYRAIGPRLPASQRGPIRAPSVAFAGATDFALRPGHYERARRLHLDRYEVVTLPGGHFLHREHPDQFHAELLARLPAPPST